MTVCITGAAGQVGMDLIRALARTGHDICATDIRPPVPEPDLPGVQWRPLDVTDPAAVLSLLREIRPDRVFHLAAMLSARGEQDPQRAYAINQTGTYNILEACRHTRVGQLIFTSSIAVFGPGLPDPVPDDAPTQPATIYGVTKAAGEMLGEYHHRRYGLDFRAVRFPGLISASLPGGGTSDYALFMYTDAIAHGHYQAYCRPDTRIPLMYMPDAVRALTELADAPPDALTRRVYNIGAFSPTAQEIAQSVCHAVPDVRLTFKPEPHRQAILDSWPRALDDSNARRDWGWKPRFTLEQMTADLVPRIRDLLHQNAHALNHSEG